MPIAGPPQSWAPCAILDLDPNLQKTCIGHANTKRRDCKNPVSKQSREKACFILRLVNALPRDSEAVTPYLMDLAKLLLCKRVHQDQASGIVDSWNLREPGALLSPPQSPGFTLPRPILGSSSPPSQAAQHILPSPAVTPSTPSVASPAETVIHNNSRASGGASSRNQSLTPSPSQRAAQDRGNDRSSYLPQTSSAHSDDNIIPVLELNSDQCPICREETAEEETLYQCTQCNYGFHQHCWNDWERHQREDFRRRHRRYPGVKCPYWSVLSTISL
jgi:hypothetical protein